MSTDHFFTEDEVAVNVFALRDIESMFPGDLVSLRSFWLMRSDSYRCNESASFSGENVLA